MSNLAQAATAQRQDDFLHINMHQFNEGGISEIGKKPEVPSVEQFILAKRLREEAAEEVATNITPEHNEEISQLFRADGSNANDIKNTSELQNAYVKRIDNEENAHDTKIFNYSVADVANEQNENENDFCDDNLSTAGGYLKKGAIDPNAHEAKEKKKSARSSLQLAQMISDQEVLEQYLSQLDERIAELQEKIDEYNNQIAEMDDVLDVLDSGDINASTSAGRIRREKLNAWAKKNDVDLDKYKKPDGSLDQNKIQEFVARRHETTVTQRNDEQVKNDKLKEKMNRAEARYNNSTNTPIATLSNNNKLRIQTDKLETNFDNSTSISSENMELTKQPVADINNDYMSEYPIISQISSNINRSNGSYANEGGSNVISPAFAMASNPATNPQEEPQTTIENQPHPTVTSYAMTS